MAWTTPRTWVAGETVTAAIMNTHVRDNLNWLDTRIGGRAATNATQAIAANTITTANNGGTAAWTASQDSGGFVSATGGTTTPITIPTGLGGIYVVGFHYFQVANSAGRLTAWLQVNGAGTYARAGNYADQEFTGCEEMPLNAGDAISLQAFTATATNISGGTNVYAYRIGD